MRSVDVKQAATRVRPFFHRMLSEREQVEADSWPRQLETRRPSLRARWAARRASRS